MSVPSVGTMGWRCRAHNLSHVLYAAFDRPLIWMNIFGCNKKFKISIAIHNQQIWISLAYNCGHYLPRNWQKPALHCHPSCSHLDQMSGC